MDKYTFAHLDSDVQLNSIGSLFKKKNGTSWGINLLFNPRQKKSSLTISNAPVLVRKRILNPTKEYTSRGWEEEVYITSTEKWQVGTVADCPIKGVASFHERNQFCFIFGINNGKKVFLPQFELGRALFLRDGYLARTALEPECLDLEFDIIHDKDNGKARINVMPNAGYPLKQFSNLESRNYLSWILLDAQASKSYRSIGLYQKTEGYDSGEYRHWNFRFDPPPLEGAHFSLRGRFDKESQSFFVYEIVKIGQVNADIPDIIEIYHPKFTIPNPKKNKIGPSAASTGSIKKINIHDDDDSNADKGRLIIHGEKVEFEFTKPFITNRISGKKRVVISTSSGEPEEDEHNSNVSLGEPVTGQGRTSADWNTIRDLTKNDHLFRSKFDCFLDMIERMTSYSGCELLSERIKKLPQVPRCSKHLLANDGNPRCIAIITLMIKEQRIILLEVDTSDFESPLSTIGLVIHNDDIWERELKNIMQKLVSSSLVWPRKATFTKIFGETGHVRIVHPRSVDSQKGSFLPDVVRGWAARCYGRLLSIV